MHILICDDDAAFGARMAEYVTVYFTARSVQVHTAVCTSAAEVLATPGLELYQLAFLDVDMPGANGMVLGRQLKQKCPGLMLVYVSAYLEFALEGYTVNAYRYLLKRDIARTLPKCLDDLLAALTDQRKTLTVHHNRTETEIPLDQIYYLESDLRQINVYGDIARQPICTTATPGKKDITSACSGCRAHFWFQLYRECATAAPTIRFAAHSAIRQQGCCHASPVRTPVNQE